MEENKRFVDLTEYLIRLWNNRKYILVCCTIGAVLGLIVGFSIPKVYDARMTFAPETEQKFGTGVSSLASMMGVSFDNSIDAINVEMFPDVVKSSPFLFPLFDIQIETRDSLQTTLLDYIVNHQKKAWWSYVFEAPFKLIELIKGVPEPTPDSLFILSNPPREARIVMKYFNDNLKLKIDKTTGKTDISIRMQDPKVAATVLEAVVENLKVYVTDYRTSKDKQDVANLTLICEERKADYYAAQKAYADFVDANKNLVLLRSQADQLVLQQEMQLAYQVYSQVATQLEGARIKEQQAKPVFVVLDPVSIPYKKSAPSKAKILFAFVFLAACISSFWVLAGKDYYKSFKDKL